MSEENDHTEGAFADESLPNEAESVEEIPETTEPQETKPSGGLKFLTVVLLLLAVGLVATPFFWGLKGGISDAVQGVPDTGAITKSAESGKWLYWLGDMHLLVLHLPIGLFAFVFLMEVFGVLSFRKFKPDLRGALIVTVVFTLAAVSTGFLLFLQGDHGAAPLTKFENNDMGMHMWGILLFAVFLILTFISKAWSRHNGKGSPLYGILLLLSASAIGFGAHFGGKLVHSNDPIEEGLVLMGLKEAEEVELVEQKSAEELAEIPVEERLVFDEVVKPILVGKCWECHADAGHNPVYPLRGKIKAGLDMTTVASLLHGGEGMPDFPTLVPGSADESEMIVLVELDADDEDFMPKGSEDHPEYRLTEGEITILRWWIDSLSPENPEADRKVKDVPGYEDVLDEIQAVTPLKRTPRLEKEEDAEVEEEKGEEVVIPVPGDTVEESESSGESGVVPAGVVDEEPAAAETEDAVGEEDVESAETEAVAEEAVEESVAEESVAEESVAEPAEAGEAAEELPGNDAEAQTGEEPVEVEDEEGTAGEGVEEAPEVDGPAEEAGEPAGEETAGDVVEEAVEESGEEEVTTESGEAAEAAEDVVDPAVAEPAVEEESEVEEPEEGEAPAEKAVETVETTEEAVEEAGEVGEEASEQVEEAVEEGAEAAEDASEDVQEAASQDVEEAAEKKVEKVTEEAEEASDKVEKAVEEVEKAAEDLDEAIEDLDEVQEPAVDEAQKQLDELSKQSDEIFEEAMKALKEVAEDAE